MGLRRVRRQHERVAPLANHPTFFNARKPNSWRFEHSRDDESGDDGDTEKLADVVDADSASDSDADSETDSDTE